MFYTCLFFFLLSVSNILNLIKLFIWFNFTFSVPWIPKIAIKWYELALGEGRGCEGSSFGQGGSTGICKRWTYYTSVNLACAFVCINVFMQAHIFGRLLLFLEKLIKNTTCINHESELIPLCYTSGLLGRALLYNL